jgi:hydrogenase maturation protease
MNEWEWNALEDTTPVDSLQVGGVELRAGDAVRLRPRSGGDVMDLALRGKTATIEAIEQDYDGGLHLAVVLDDDPGKDLGLQRQPGHRFFFKPDEVQKLPQILVAGIGNIFFGDDAFGVEVAQRLASRPLPGNVRVGDFGIRGFDLACALLDGPDVSILVDACPGGFTPGTLQVIEPDLNSIGARKGEQSSIEPHGLNPVNVIHLAKSMEGRLSKILVVGCEPESLGGEDGRMGLSEPVAGAVEEAITLIESLVADLLHKEIGLTRRRPSPKET